LAARPVPVGVPPRTAGSRLNLASPDDARARHRAGRPAPGDGGGADANGPLETRDREPIELLNELRVALPGARARFAFLPVVPFSSTFDVDDAEKTVYVLALLATILLMAPSAHKSSAGVRRTRSACCFPRTGSRSAASWRSRWR